MLKYLAVAALFVGCSCASGKKVIHPDGKEASNLWACFYAEDDNRELLVCLDLKDFLEQVRQEQETEHL